MFPNSPSYVPCFIVAGAMTFRIRLDTLVRPWITLDNASLSVKGDWMNLQVSSPQNYC